VKFVHLSNRLITTTNKNICTKDVLMNVQIQDFQLEWFPDIAVRIFILSHKFDVDALGVVTSNIKSNNIEHDKLL